MKFFAVKKGQFSFDLIFAIIAVIIFLHFISGFSTDFIASQNKISIYDQKMSIAVSVKEAIDSCYILKGSGAGSTARIKFLTSKLLGFSGSQECTISLPGSKVIVTHTNPDASTEALELGAPELSNYAQINCGDILDISC